MAGWVAFGIGALLGLVVVGYGLIYLGLGRFLQDTTESL